MGLSRELYQMVGGMAGGEYPDFVVKDGLGDEIPAFTYHRVDKENFEEQLRHLKRNGYETLNSEQLGRALSSVEAVPKRVVVLTFDDGLDDLYSVVFPLLRSYGFQGVAFIAPHWVGGEGIVDWQQVREMHRSGVLDFQAHSYTHGRIPISPEIVDFFHPEFSFYRRWELPFTETRSEASPNSLPAWGMPLCPSASCLSEKRRYLGNPSLEKFCIDYVKKQGGEEFFKVSLWRRKLKRVVRDYLESNPHTEGYETKEEQEGRIRQEIALSKKVIEERLAGKKVVSFSYPYHERGEIADRVLRESGYQIVFGGIGRDERFDSGNGSLTYIRRVSGDFVLRLPGGGRSSLLRLYLSKGLRRMKRGPMY